MREAKGWLSARRVRSQRTREGKSQQAPERRADYKQHANMTGDGQIRPVHIARTENGNLSHVRQVFAPGPVFWLRTFRRSPSHLGGGQDSGIRSVDFSVLHSGASASDLHRLPYVMPSITAEHDGQTAAQEQLAS
jgi:hypothetical protein